MLKSLYIENFTVFPKANLQFGKNLNVMIGENGTGKSHVLKAAYTAIAVSAARGKTVGTDEPTKDQLQRDLAAKLQGVFHPDGIGRLVRRHVGNGKCLLKYEFDSTRLNLTFTFSTKVKTEVTVTKMPTGRVEKLPIFLPTHELLTIYPGFVSLYETTQLPFEETFRDTCILLGAPLARGAREANIKRLLIPIEKAMGGIVVLERDRFYINMPPNGKMEMHLVAEGWRKLATVARLIATGSLLDKGYLFWDEPEANLNPRIIKLVARTILDLCEHGIQVFVATHSLFLLRELHILQKHEFAGLDTRYFGLHNSDVGVLQGPNMEDVGDIAALDEDLEQSDRYIDTEMGLR